jgi:DNA primase
MGARVPDFERVPGLAAEIKRQMPLLQYMEDHMGITGVQKDKYFSAHCFNTSGHQRGDKSRSLSIRDDEGTYHCFACEAKGDVITAYSIVNNMSNEEAYVELARNLGLLKPRELSDPENMLAFAARRYHGALVGDGIPAKQDALDYLTKERGLTRETIEKFGIGYCWSSDLKKLPKELRQTAIDAGLAWKPKPDSKVDHLWPQMGNRITFPISDINGVVIGFGGRVVPGGYGSDSAKYMNTSETELFKKSQVLFGASQARKAIRKEGAAFVLEGYMDVVGLSQAGIENAVAVMGAGLNEEGFLNLWKLTEHAIFCLDPDKAGRTGTARSIRAAGPTLTDRLRISVMRLETDLDPDEYVLEHGAEHFIEKGKRALTLAQFLVQLEAESCNLFAPEDRAKFIDRMKSIAEEFPNAPETREQIVKEARAICGAAIADAALHFTGLDLATDEAELTLAIRLLERQLAAAREARLASERAVSAPPAAEHASEEILLGEPAVAGDQLNESAHRPMRPR